MRRIEQLKEAQRLCAGVLDEVRHGFRHIADVAGAIVESARICLRSEHGHTALARHIELPFVLVGVPVDFAHPT
jgi:hypothetical protein